MAQATPQEKSYRRKRQKMVFCCGIDASRLSGTAHASVFHCERNHQMASQGRA
jgi:hypothetical protein